MREDDGDAETGRGLEVAGGLRYQNRDRGLFAEVTTRSLVSHEDEIYREWGVGGTLRLDPGPDYLGLAIQINSSHGAAASSVQRLWSDPGAVSYLPGMVQGRHEAEIGYGFETLRGGAMVIPFSGFAYSPSGANSFRLGSRLRLGSRWILSLQADRNQYGFREPWYGVVLRGPPASGAMDAPGAGRGEPIGPAGPGFVRAGGSGRNRRADCPRGLPSPTGESVSKGLCGGPGGPATEPPKRPRTRSGHPATYRP